MTFCFPLFLGPYINPILSITFHLSRHPHAYSSIHRFIHQFNKPERMSMAPLIPQDVETQHAQYPEPQGDPVRKSRLFQRFKIHLRSSIWSWILVLISFIFVSFTVLLAWGIANVDHYFGIFRDYTAAVRMLRVLAEVNTILLTTLTAISSRAAIWAASSSRSGVSMYTWLAMSPATGILGLAKLFWWRQNGRDTRDWHRLYCLIRLHLFYFATYFRILLHIAIPVISVLISSVV